MLVLKELLGSQLAPCTDAKKSAAFIIVYGRKAYNTAILAQFVLVRPVF
jgi:hypothetical protein